jgi:hypothetical protein
MMAHLGTLGGVIMARRRAGRRSCRVGRHSPDCEGQGPRRTGLEGSAPLTGHGQAQALSACPGHLPRRGQAKAGKVDFGNLPMSWDDACLGVPQ